MSEAELTDKQVLFAHKYADLLNGTEAARQAGYAGNDNVLGVTAYDNLRNPKIRALVDQLLEARSMTKGEVLARLTDIARGSMGEFLKINGTVSFDFKKAQAAGKLHLIKSVTKGRRGTKVELYSSIEALDKIARALGMYIDRTDITSGGEKLNNGVTDEGFNRAISSLADAIRESLPGANAKPEGAMDAAKQAPMAGAPIEGG